ncbi:MAG: DUF1449 domain-containing protein [Prochloraceae cyanobacterium]
MVFDLANLTYWIFLAIGILLFLIVIFSGGGDDDLDLDADGDVDIDTDANFGPVQILGFLGVGKVPLLLLLAVDFSLWGLIGWVFNIFIASAIGSIPTGFFGGIILFGSFAVSIYTGGLISRPLGKVFASFGEDTSSDRSIGCVATVVSPKVPYTNSGKIAQADVFDAASNLSTINITLPQWAKIIPVRGDRVLIIDLHKNAYLAVAKDSVDESRWLENRD